MPSILHTPIHNPVRSPALAGVAASAVQQQEQAQQQPEQAQDRGMTRIPLHAEQPSKPPESAGPPPDGVQQPAPPSANAAGLSQFKQPPAVLQLFDRDVNIVY